tara:strand:+ start:178 stop:432 length:255 start_codon:yes stop_codon:yes gene_type:complete
MNRTKKIKTILEKKFIDFDINVKDDSESHKGHNDFNGSGETHIIVELKKKSLLKFTRLDLHRKINYLLSDEFNRGLHSLQIKII